MATGNGRESDYFLINVELGVVFDAVVSEVLRRFRGAAYELFTAYRLIRLRPDEEGMSLEAFREKMRGVDGVDLDKISPPERSGWKPSESNGEKQ